MAAQMDAPNEQPDDDTAAALARDAQVAALRREYYGYERYGRTERAEQVAAALEALGAPLEDAADSTPRERAVPKRRSSRAT